jgi:hypothetical protein
MSCSLFHGSWVSVGSELFAISFRTILTYARTDRETCEAGYFTVVFWDCMESCLKLLASMFYEVFCSVIGYILFAACVTCFYYSIERCKVV